MSLPNDCFHHATMLKDKVRIDSFSNAMKEVILPTDSVVDIGAGTGILSAIATQLTTGSVSAIEYFSASANCAKQLFKEASLANVTVIEKSSFEVKLPTCPDVVVSETIGAVGPEENIVELCYVFKKRHPEIRNFIPSVLNLYAVEVCSESIARNKNEFLDAFLDTRVGNFSFSPLKEELDAEFSKHIHCQVDSNTQTLEESTLLTSYKLGSDKLSTFEKLIEVKNSQCNALHVYFEAVLSPKVTLSSQNTAPLTHWKHCFVAKPNDKNLLKIAYLSQNQKWSLVWL